MGSMEAAAMVLPIVVVGLLGVTSSVLGFVAEAKKLTVSTMTVPIFST